MTAMIRALRHRNFRLFFIGQGISLIGTWMQSTALPWLVYRLTDDMVLLGVVSFTSQILTFVMAPLAGVLADRWNRHRLVLLAQVVAMVQAMVLAALVITDRAAVWHIILLSLVTGFVRGFEVPIRQSFVIQMLDDRADLPNAIALNSFLVNGARLIGPTAAGAVIVAAGEGVCFLLNGVSYLAVIASLLAMRIPAQAAPPPATDVVGGMKEGLRYAAGTPPIRSILLLLTVVSLMGVPYQALMPVFARDVLQGGPRTMGYLTGAVGVGALAGAVALVRRRSVQGMGRLIVLAAASFGLALAAFALSRRVWLSLPLLAWAGASMMTQMASSNTLLQTLTDEDKRGRVMSFYTMAFMGMVPFGSLLAGWLADWIGAPATVVVGGGACVAGAILFGSHLPGVERYAPAAAQAEAARRPPTADGTTE